MSILSKILENNLSIEGKEALKLREEYIQTLLKETSFDETDLIFKSTSVLESMVSSIKETKIQSIKEKNRVLEFRIEQLSKN